MLVALIVGIVILAAIGNWLPGPRARLSTAPPGSNATDSAAPRSAVGLPDPRRTPGSINPKVTQDNIADTICKRGWTATIRPPAAYTNALKVVQIREYGYPDHALADYEEDHLVPLELGGAPRDPANLWPEPRTIALPDGTSVAASAKDGLENHLNDQVCNRSTPLANAQRLIAGDWIAAWLDAGRP